MTKKPAKSAKPIDALNVPDEGMWTFDNDNVASNFDAHVRTQLPWYDMATDIVLHMGRHYLPNEGVMYDIGASTGNITKSLREVLEHRKCKAFSIEQSEAFREHFKGFGPFIVSDARTHDFSPFDFASIFLVLMFMTPMKQRELLENLWTRLRPGGAIVVFDKTADFHGYAATVIHRLTIAGKRMTGTPDSDIISKELSLAGVQRPINPEYVFSSLPNYTEIFRYGEFAGWLITKD